MSKDKFFERVEAYMEGGMDAEQRQVFEREAETDTELKEAIQKYKLSMEALDVLSEEALKGKFQEWRKEQNQGVKDGGARIVDLASRSGKLWNIAPRVRWIAAAVLVLIMAYPVYFWISDAPGSDNYFVSLAQPLDGETLRSGAPASWINGMEAYEEKDYTKAIELFASLEPINDQIRFYLGHSYYLNGDYKEAEKQFKEIVTLDKTVYKEEAEWALLACMYFLSPDQPGFDSLLNKILDFEQHSFHSEAMQLKERLAEE